MKFIFFSFFLLTYSCSVKRGEKIENVKIGLDTGTDTGTGTGTGTDTDTTVSQEDIMDAATYEYLQNILAAEKANEEDKNRNKEIREALKDKTDYCKIDHKIPRAGSNAISYRIELETTTECEESLQIKSILNKTEITWSIEKPFQLVLPDGNKKCIYQTKQADKGIPLSIEEIADNQLSTIKNVSIHMGRCTWHACKNKNCSSIKDQLFKARIPQYLCKNPPYIQDFPDEIIEKEDYLLEIEFDQDSISTIAKVANSSKPASTASHEFYKTLKEKLKSKVIKKTWNDVYNYSKGFLLLTLDLSPEIRHIRRIDMQKLKFYDQYDEDCSITATTENNLCVKAKTSFKIPFERPSDWDKSSLSRAEYPKISLQMEDDCFRRTEDEVLKDTTGNFYISQTNPEDGAIAEASQALDRIKTIWGQTGIPKTTDKVFIGTENASSKIERTVFHECQNDEILVQVNGTIECRKTTTIPGRGSGSTSEGCAADEIPKKTENSWACESFTPEELTTIRTKLELNCTDDATIARSTALGSPFVCLAKGTDYTTDCLKSDALTPFYKKDLSRDYQCDDLSENDKKDIFQNYCKKMDETSKGQITRTATKNFSCRDTQAQNLRCTANQYYYKETEKTSKWKCQNKEDYDIFQMQNSKCQDIEGQETFTFTKDPSVTQTQTSITTTATDGTTVTTDTRLSSMQFYCEESNHAKFCGIKTTTDEGTPNSTLQYPKDNRSNNKYQCQALTDDDKKVLTQAYCGDNMRLVKDENGLTCKSLEKCSDGTQKTQEACKDANKAWVIKSVLNCSEDTYPTSPQSDKSWKCDPISGAAPTVAFDLKNIVPFYYNHMCHLDRGQKRYLRNKEEMRNKREETSLGLDSEQRETFQSQYVFHSFVDLDISMILQIKPRENQKKACDAAGFKWGECTTTTGSTTTTNKTITTQSDCIVNVQSKWYEKCSDRGQNGNDLIKRNKAKRDCIKPPQRKELNTDYQQNLSDTILLDGIQKLEKINDLPYEFKDPYFPVYKSQQEKIFQDDVCTLSNSCSNTQFQATKNTWQDLAENKLYTYIKKAQELILWTQNNCETEAKIKTNLEEETCYPCYHETAFSSANKCVEPYNVYGWKKSGIACPNNKTSTATTSLSETLGSFEPSSSKTGFCRFPYRTQKKLEIPDNACESIDFINKSVNLFKKSGYQDCSQDNSQDNTMFLKQCKTNSALCTDLCSRVTMAIPNGTKYQGRYKTNQLVMPEDQGGHSVSYNIGTKSEWIAESFGTISCQQNWGDFKKSLRPTNWGNTVTVKRPDTWNQWEFFQQRFSSNLINAAQNLELDKVDTKKNIKCSESAKDRSEICHIAHFVKSYNKCQEDIGIRFSKITLSNKDYIWEFKTKDALTHNPFLDRNHYDLARETYPFGGNTSKKTFINALWRLRSPRSPNLDEITTWNEGKASIHKFHWKKPSESHFSLIDSCEL